MSDPSIYRYCCCNVICTEAESCKDLNNCALWPEELELNAYFSAVFFTRFFDSQSTLVWGMIQEITWSLTCSVFRIPDKIQNQQPNNPFDPFGNLLSFLKCSDIELNNFDDCLNTNITENFRTGCLEGTSEDPPNVSYSSACCDQFRPKIIGTARRTFYVPTPVPNFYSAGTTQDDITFELPVRIIAGCDSGTQCQDIDPSNTVNRAIFKIKITPPEESNVSGSGIVWPSKSNLILHDCYQDKSIKKVPECCDETYNLNGYNPVQTIPWFSTSFSGIQNIRPSTEIAGKPFCTNKSSIIPEEYGNGNSFYFPRNYKIGTCPCNDQNYINCLSNFNINPEGDFVFCEDISEAMNALPIFAPSIDPFVNDGCRLLYPNLCGPSGCPGFLNDFACVKEFLVDVSLPN